MAQHPASDDRASAAQERAAEARLRTLVGPIVEDVDRWLVARADRWVGAAPLPEAMRYALLQGGKRIRPVIAVACCEAVGGGRSAAEGAACALELVHAYSLVHDDLPAMDDDDLRRGLPTVHRRWDEATAILVGDALLTDAFAALAEPPDGVSAEDALACVALLAEAAGAAGMVGGQMRDIRLGVPTRESIAVLHAEKTGALFRAAAELGARCGGAPQVQRHALVRWGSAMGRAFQIRDDLLDAASEGGGEQEDIVNLARVLGGDGARRELALSCNEALACLRAEGLRTELLEALTRWVGDSVASQLATVQSDG